MSPLPDLKLEPTGEAGMKNVSVKNIRNPVFTQPDSENREICSFFCFEGSGAKKNLVEKFESCHFLS